MEQKKKTLNQKKIAISEMIVRSDGHQNELLSIIRENSETQRKDKKHAREDRIKQQKRKDKQHDDFIKLFGHLVQPSVPFNGFGDTQCLLEELDQSTDWTHTFGIRFGTPHHDF